MRLSALSLFARFLILSLAPSFVGCQSIPSTTPGRAAGQKEESADLTRTEAEARKARVSEVHYNLDVHLTEGGKTFSGKNSITFKLTDNTKPLRLDFFEGQISSLTVNGKALGAETKKKFTIELPASSLRAGDNLVLVAYSAEYSHQGQGLHQYIDTETQQTFLYTQFETYDANRFMPCFDQPDLRATFQLRVDAPATWQVISTTRETSVKTGSATRKVWMFPPSLPIATYLFSLHAGPYKVWNDRFEDIPLRLFARPSMAKYVNAKEWFLWTKQGLKFYNSFFAYRYPFQKYDQIVVPEFNAGAMENVAAITFTETYLRRSQPTRTQRRHVASVVLHEMAHMWFGDIVTMRWWNNLWLNESFATFMAALSLHEATEFKESWQEFYASDKNWAYWEDGLVTTHPIEAPVQSVKDAFANFDGITYGKGASVLHQLYAYMSPDKFRAGLQDYIKTNAFKNADLKQFIDKLQAQTDKDLNLWAERWLRQNGADKLTAKWTCNGDQLHQIELSSSAKKGAPSAGFRPQALKLALFGEQKGGALGPATVMNVDLKQSPQFLLGTWPCPAFVYPNFGDEGYGQVKLDPHSLKYAKANVRKIDDALLRTMVWNDLWQMVRETEMPLNDYIQIVSTQFGTETDEILLEQLVNTISGRRSERGTVLYYWPVQTDREKAARSEFIGQIEAQYLKHLHDAKPGTDQQRFWLDSYVSVARTPGALDQLSKWSKQKQVAPGFELDIDRRWVMVRQLARFNHPDAPAMIAKLKTDDTTERGQKSALASEAVQPNPLVKQKWVDIVKQPKPAVSFAEVRTVLGSLFPVEQSAMALPFANEYYTYLTKNGASENEIFVDSFAMGMSPLNCGLEQSSRLKSFLTGTKGFAPTVTKTLRVELQEDERCQSIRAASALLF